VVPWISLTASSSCPRSSRATPSPRLLDERHDALRLEPGERGARRLLCLGDSPGAQQDFGEREVRVNAVPERDLEVARERETREALRLLQTPPHGRDPRPQSEVVGVRVVRAHVRRGRQPLVGLVQPALRHESEGDQERLAGRVRAVLHLIQHGVGGARLALGRHVVSGEHLDDDRDVGAVRLEVAKPEVVHDRAPLGDHVASGVESAGHPLQTADAKETARPHLPVACLREDRPAPRQSGLDGLGPPQRIRGDLADRRSFALPVAGRARVLEGARLERGSPVVVAAPREEQC
jgi:hypothetical protein